MRWHVVIVVLFWHMSQAMELQKPDNPFKKLFDNCLSQQDVCTYPVLHLFGINDDQELEPSTNALDCTITDKNGYYFIYPYIHSTLPQGVTSLFDSSRQRTFIYNTTKLVHSMNMIDELTGLNYGPNDDDIPMLDALVQHIYTLYKIHLMPQSLEELNTIVSIVVQTARNHKEFADNIAQFKVKKRIKKDTNSAETNTVLPCIVIYPIVNIDAIRMLINTLHNLFNAYQVIGSSIVPRFSFPISTVISLAQNDGRNKYENCPIAHLYDNGLNKAFFKENALKIKKSAQEIDTIIKELKLLDNNANNDQDARWLIDTKIKNWAATLLLRDIIEALLGLDSTIQKSHYTIDAFLKYYDSAALRYEMPYVYTYLQDKRDTLGHTEALGLIAKALLATPVCSNNPYYSYALQKLYDTNNDH